MARTLTDDEKQALCDAIAVGHVLFPHPRLNPDTESWAYVWAWTGMTSMHDRRSLSDARNLLNA